MNTAITNGYAVCNQLICVGENFMSSMKNKLKNFTVMPAPMQVVKSDKARMTGTCAGLMGPHRRTASSLVSRPASPSTSPSAGASAAAPHGSCAAPSRTGGSSKNNKGKQLSGSKTHPAMIVTFICSGRHSSPRIERPTPAMKGPHALPTVFRMAFVVNRPERWPCGMLSAKSASDVLLESSAKTPRKTSAAYSTSTMSVAQATIASTAVARANTEDNFKSRARRVGKASTRRPTGKARTRLEMPEMLSAMPTRLFRACFGAKVGPMAAPPPR
mmetsp:Transcript_75498/g.230923  ORF Transcript_75498/g.230923 Transcript_75498/m.230923 type:complete len:273 (+) Transcript_75498:602-1420(+)